MRNLMRYILRPNVAAFILSVGGFILLWTISFRLMCGVFCVLWAEGIIAPVRNQSRSKSDRSLEDFVDLR